MCYIKELQKLMIVVIVISFSLLAVSASAFENVSFVNEIHTGFKQPVDAAVSSSRNIYVLDSKLCKVSIIDPAGDLIKEFGSCGHDDGEFSRPGGISVTPEGNVAVADTNNNRIQVFDSEGNFQFAFGSAGSERGAFKKPSGVAVDEQGMIYVSDTGNNRLQVFSAKGVYRFRVPFDVPPLDVSTDALNRAYVLLPENGEVRIYDLIKSDVTRLRPLSSGKNYLKKATSISVDFRGDIYFTEQAQDSVKKIDNHQNIIMTFGSEGRGRGQFKKPAGITADRNGHIFIADSGNKRVQEFKITGSTKPALDTSGLASLMSVEYKDSIPARTELADIKVTPAGDFQTLSSKSNSLFITGAGTRVIGGKAGRKKGQFSHPSAVDYGPKGYIYIADTGNNRVQIMDPDGNFVFTFGERGRKTGQFKEPCGIAVAKDGTIYVADTGNNRIQIFNKDGIFLKAFGKESSNDRDEIPANGTFRHPTAMALDSLGRVFVVDRDNNRLQIFDSSGNFVESIGSQGDGYKQFNNPVDVALTSDDILLVADAGNNRIQLIHPGLIKFQFVFGAPTEGLGQLKELSGIDVDSNNNIYVTDSAFGTIRVFNIIQGRKRQAEVVKPKKRQPDTTPAVEEDDNQEFELK